MALQTQLPEEKKSGFHGGDWRLRGEGRIYLATPLFVDASKECRFGAWEIQSKKVNDNKREDHSSLKEG